MRMRKSSQEFSTDKLMKLMKAFEDELIVEHSRSKPKFDWLKMNRGVIID